MQGKILRLAAGRAGSWRGEVEVSGGTIETGIYTVGGDRPVPVAEGERFEATGVKATERQETISLAVTDYTTVRSLQGAE